MYKNSSAIYTECWLNQFNLNRKEFEFRKIFTKNWEDILHLILLDYDKYPISLQIELKNVTKDILDDFLGIIKK